jgi:hypothetical protein
MNELKAALRNRIHSFYLDEELKQLDREKTSFLTRRNRHVSNLETELELIRASTGVYRKSLARESETIRANSNLETTSQRHLMIYSSPNLDRKRSQVMSALSKELPRKRARSSETIEKLKTKDPVFARQIKKFETYKQAGRVPQFSDLNVKLNKNFPKSLINRQRKELIEITKLNLQKRENHKYTSQKSLQEQISLFINKKTPIK